MKIMSQLLNRIKNLRNKLSSFQLIILGFFVVLLLGAILLTLPFSSKNGEYTPFHEALFTATSALCVTGLVVKDTASYWSYFGQTVILLLIQIGGLGVITIVLSLISLTRRKMTLRDRTSLQDAFSAPEIGSISALLKMILRFTFITELVGACLMMPAFCRDHGAIGVWMAFFHSVSAFCNAGFDVLGTVEQPFQSMTSYVADPLVNIVLILLIILGGIGFLVINDLKVNKSKFRKYRLQTKLTLIATPVLILLPSILFFLLDNTSRPIGEGILASLFQSVATRTAGFNTVDLAVTNDVSKAVTIVLMLIGASSASTAGGLKVTTVCIVALNFLATIRRKDSPVVFGRRISDENVKTASTIFSMYLLLFFFGGCAICILEGLPLGDCLFESASAIGTAGLTLGITSTLGLPSQIILIVLMFLGRVGGLTMCYATFARKDTNSKYPLEGVVLG